MSGLHVALVLEPAELQRQQLCGRDAPGHLRQPDLDGLVLRQRPVEQDPRPRVVQQLRQAGLRCADDSPGDAVARLRQAGQRTLQAHHSRQNVLLGDDDVVEEQGRGDRGAQ